jgi:hypothetical protein
VSDPNTIDSDIGDSDIGTKKPDRGAVGRRRLLRLGGMAAAGAAVATVAAIADAKPAAAGVDGDVVLGSSANAATTATGIGVSGTTAGYGFGVTDNGLSSLGSEQPSVLAHAKGTAFFSAIYALAENNARAVRASSAGGSALYATSAGTQPTIEAVQFGTGECVHVEAGGGDCITTVAFDTGRGLVAYGDGSGTAVVAEAGSTGVGIQVSTTSTTNVSPAVRATSGGKGAAISAGSTSHATAPTVQATSASAQPAVRATGKAVPVSAAAPVAGNAAALSVQGVASFTRSGVVSLTGAASSVVVSVPGGLTATSHVLATLQTNTGTVAVRAAVPNPANGKVTIFLGANAPAGTKIAWFVFG